MPGGRRDHASTGAKTRGPMVSAHCSEPAFVQLSNDFKAVIEIGRWTIRTYIRLDRDRKISGSCSGRRSRGRIFFSRVSFLC